MTRTLRSDLGSFGTHASRAVPGWVGGAMTGLQATILSMGAVVAVALAVAAAAPPADGAVAVDWEAAASVGMRIWLLAHAVPATGAGVAVGLVPLGLTFLFASLTSGLARRFAAPTTGGWLSLTVSYSAIVALVASSSGAEGGPVIARGALVGALVAGVGGASGLRRAGWAPFGGLHLPPALGEGVRLGAATALLGCAAGAGVFALGALAGWHDIAGVAHALQPDPVGALVLATGEAAYAPTLAIWGLAWLSGSGFSVGAGSIYAPGHLVAVPLPSVPILGALPHASGGLLILAPLVIVVAAAAARIASRKSIPLSRRGVGIQAIGVAVAAALSGAAAIAARGGLGGAALAQTGPNPILVALWVGLLAAVGFAAATGGLSRRDAPVSRETSPAAVRETVAAPRGAPARPPRMPARTPSRRR